MSITIKQAVKDISANHRQGSYLYRKKLIARLQTLETDLKSSGCQETTLANIEEADIKKLVCYWQGRYCRSTISIKLSGLRKLFDRHHLRDQFPTTASLVGQYQYQKKRKFVAVPLDHLPAGDFRMMAYLQCVAGLTKQEAVRAQWFWFSHTQAAYVVRQAAYNGIDRLASIAKHPYQAVWQYLSQSINLMGKQSYRQRLTAYGDHLTRLGIDDHDNYRYVYIHALAKQLDGQADYWHQLRQQTGYRTTRSLRRILCLNVNLKLPNTALINWLKN